MQKSIQLNASILRRLRPARARQTTALRTLLSIAVIAACSTLATAHTAAPTMPPEQPDVSGATLLMPIDVVASDPLPTFSVKDITFKDATLHEALRNLIAHAPATPPITLTFKLTEADRATRAKISASSVTGTFADAINNLATSVGFSYTYKDHALTIERDQAQTLSLASVAALDDVVPPMLSSLGASNVALDQATHQLSYRVSRTAQPHIATYLKSVRDILPAHAPAGALGAELQTCKAELDQRQQAVAAMAATEEGRTRHSANPSVDAPKALMAGQEQQLRNARAETRQTSAKATEAESERTALAARVTELDAALKTRTTERDQLLAQLKSVADERAKATPDAPKSAVIARGKQLIDARTDAKAAHDKAAAAEAQRLALASQITTLEASIKRSDAAVQQAVADAIAQRAEQNGQIGDLNSELENTRKALLLAKAPPTPSTARMSHNTCVALATINVDGLSFHDQPLSDVVHMLLASRGYQFDAPSALLNTPITANNVGGPLDKVISSLAAHLEATSAVAGCSVRFQSITRH